MTLDLDSTCKHIIQYDTLSYKYSRKPAQSMNQAVKVWQLAWASWSMPQLHCLDLHLSPSMAIFGLFLYIIQIKKKINKYIKGKKNKLIKGVKRTKEE